MDWQPATVWLIGILEDAKHTAPGGSRELRKLAWRDFQFRGAGCGVCTQCQQGGQGREGGTPTQQRRLTPSLFRERLHSVARTATPLVDHLTRRSLIAPTVDAQQTEFLTVC